MRYLLRAIAAAVGGVVEGDDSLPIDGMMGLEEADSRHLSFLANRRYARLLASTAAGAVILDRKTKAPPGLTVIRVDDPYRAFATALALFDRRDPFAPGVDERAFVGEGAQVEGARIDAFAWIGPGAEVGAGTHVHATAFVGADARVGRDCRLMPGSVVMEGCALGDRVWLNPGAVVGGEGFGFAPGPEGHLKIPQIGAVIIEDDVEIGANSCVDRAAMNVTRVRRGAKLDNLVQIGHAAEVGEHDLLVAYSGVAGSTRLGRGVVLGARAAVLGHLEIGDGVQVGASSTVHDDQPAGAKVTGTPAIEHRRWLRAATAFGELPELLTRLRALEGRVAELEALLASKEEERR